MEKIIVEMQKGIDNFYTIIVQILDGGIYVSQYLSDDETNLMEKWVNSLLVNNTIEELSVDNLLELFKEISKADNMISPLNDRVNVWFGFYDIDNKSLYVNIVKTALPSVEEVRKGIIIKDNW